LEASCTRFLSRTYRMKQAWVNTELIKLAVLLFNHYCNDTDYGTDQQALLGSVPDYPVFGYSLCGSFMTSIVSDNWAHFDWPSVWAWSGCSWLARKFNNTEPLLEETLLFYNNNVIFTSSEWICCIWYQYISEIDQSSVWFPAALQWRWEPAQMLPSARLHAHAAVVPDLQIRPLDFGDDQRIAISWQRSTHCNLF
jgi:hypothetical protein